MKTFKIICGIGEAVGGIEEIIEAPTTAEANAIAKQKAIEAYQSLEGRYGIKSTVEIEKEYEVDWLEAEEIYKDEMESSIDYFVEEIK